MQNYELWDRSFWHKHRMKWSAGVGIVLLSYFIAVNCSQKTYNGYHLLSIPIRSKQDLKFVTQLQEGDVKIDMWSEPKAVGHNATVAVPPESVLTVTAALRFAGITPYVVTDNLQGWINALKDSVDSETSEPFGRMRQTFRLHNYHSHEKINQFLENVARRCQEGIYNDDISCEVLSIGESYEGREMNVLHIFPRTTDIVPAIWIDAGIHAREWAAPATAIYIIYKLLDTASELETQNLLMSFQWYILPSANPDGYEYSHTTDRMWRKTRSPNTGSFCDGVDPNRNWDFHWNEVGASDRPCSDIYAGPYPFSERETQVISDFILENKDQFLVYLTMHAYGQYWLTPWGYTEEHPQDYEDLVDVANAAVDAIYAQSRSVFTVGSSTNVLYAAAGGSDDWAKGVAGIKYAFTVELRDSGNYGFMLPSSQIVPSGKEMWAGVKAMAEKVLQHVEDGKTTFSSE